MKCGTFSGSSVQSGVTVECGFKPNYVKVIGAMYNSSTTSDVNINSIYTKGETVSMQAGQSFTDGSRFTITPTDTGFTFKDSYSQSGYTFIYEAMNFPS